jgi:hypothetical protein
MFSQLFHIFRNTPFGRETFMQSLYFCQQIKSTPVVYIPQFIKFLMYFDNDVVQVDLDASYLTDPDTAEAHARELIAAFDHPERSTAVDAPVLPSTRIPPEFDSLHGISIGVRTGGSGRLEQSAWMVFFDYRAGRPSIVGLLREG